MARRTTDTDTQHEPPGSRLDRRRFLVAGGTATAAAALGARGLTATGASASKRRIGAYRRSAQPNILKRVRPRPVEQHGMIDRLKHTKDMDN